MVLKNDFLAVTLCNTARLIGRGDDVSYLVDPEYGDCGVSG